MNMNDALQMIREPANTRAICQQILGRAKKSVNGEPSFICPFCGHGKGESKGGDGLTLNPKSGRGSGLHCFGCDFSGDVLDLIGKMQGIPDTDFNSKLRRAASYLKIDVDGAYNEAEPRKTQTEPKAQKEGAPMNTTEQKIERPAEPKTNYKNAFIEANKNLYPNTDYRGISFETLNRLNVGYVEKQGNKTGLDVIFDKAMIFPTSDFGYAERNLNPNAGHGDRYRKHGEASPFNAKAIYNLSKPCFIVEGFFDAPSIIDAGGEAVALGTTHSEKLIEMMKARKPVHKVIVSLDNDEPGQEAQKDFVEKLKKMDIPYVIYNIAGKYKDANEYYMNDRESFELDVKRITEKILQGEREELEKESDGVLLDDIRQKIADSENATMCSTGFAQLDKILGGGLRAGLYIVGAISALGKTTFCLQMVNNIAMSGYDVLIVSLEMAREELVAKTISRLTRYIAGERNLTAKYAKTTLGILDGRRYSRYGEEEREIIEEAFLRYSAYASHIFTIVGIGDVDVTKIRNEVERHTAITGRAPVVLIDYLQIIAPADVRATDKQNTDKAVLELKRISRDFNTPVIGISSFNRDNYNAPVNMASFKESGAIEYSSDVLIGLQLHGMDDPKAAGGIGTIIAENNRRVGRGEPKELDLKVLKNRNGVTGRDDLHFYPQFNCFQETVFSYGEALELNATITADR